MNLLGALGYRVAVGARDEARLETAVEKLCADGADAFGTPLDVTSDQSVTAAAELIARKAGRLDALINNAGDLFEPMESSRTSFHLSNYCIIR